MLVGKLKISTGAMPAVLHHEVCLLNNPTAQSSTKTRNGSVTRLDVCNNFAVIEVFLTMQVQFADIRMVWTGLSCVLLEGYI
jgi:hypothetical protein